MAAISGNLKLKGRSGRTYNIAIYAPDAVATAWTFNSAGAAASTSPSQIRVPEDCVVLDFCATAGPAATGVIFQANSANLSGGTCLWATQLTSLPNRTPLNIPYSAGDFMSVLQF